MQITGGRPSQAEAVRCPCLAWSGNGTEPVELWPRESWPGVLRVREHGAGAPFPFFLYEKVPAHSGFWKSRLHADNLAERSWDLGEAGEVPKCKT